MVLASNSQNASVRHLSTQDVNKYFLDIGPSGKISVETLSFEVFFYKWTYLQNRKQAYSYQRGKGWGGMY